MNKKKICKQLIDIEDLVYFSVKKPIQCAPKDFSPIFFDFKKIFHYPKIRKSISLNLLKIIDKNVDCICGLESGGNYYASYIADKLNKPVIFFRKNNKKFKNCNNKERIAGNIFNTISTVALIDDVLATGITAKEAIEYFQKNNISCEFYTIFSYGHNEILNKKLNTNIHSLITFKDFLNLKSFLDENKVKIIKKHIAGYDKYFN